MNSIWGPKIRFNFTPTKILHLKFFHAITTRPVTKAPSKTFEKKSEKKKLSDVSNS